METKRIKCPNCGVVLDVRNSKNETLKIITCPQCQTQLRVKFHPQPAPSNEPLDAETFVAANKNTGDTILNKKKPEAVGKPVIAFAGINYPLALGQNIVGRQAASSHATVQIATTDHYMSRHHVSISVTRLGDGSLKAVVSNYKNMNPTRVNGLKLEEGDAIVLQPGCNITMGETTVTYNINVKTQ